MDPINYQLNVKSPFESAVQGVQLGTQLAAATDASQQRQLALQQQKQMQTDLATLSQKKDPTAQDFAAITTKYPVLASHFKDTWSMLNQDQQQARLGQATQIYAALNAGQTDVAADLASKLGEGYQNSGNEKDANTMNTLSQLIKSSPDTAKTSTGLLLSSILGPDKFTETFATLQKLPGQVAEGQAKATTAGIEAGNAANKADLENKNVQSQIENRTGQLNLDRDKLTSDVQVKLAELAQKAGTLDDGAKKIINDSTVAQVAANQSSGQMTDLANRLEKAGGGYGAFSSAGEWLKQQTGSQNYMSQLRNEYTRIRNTSVMSMLPPGSASDKDIAIAQKGFPSETADASTIASFLRGMAKIQQASSAVDSAKAEWVNSVGHLGKPKTDISIDGITVPAGTTFGDFIKGYLPKKSAQVGNQQTQQGVANRSYMRFAQPGQGQ